MNQYFQDGRYIDYTSEADVAAGTFIRIGNKIVHSKTGTN